MSSQIEKDNKVKVAGPIPIASWFIILTELCERFSYYGASLLMMPYMMKVLDLNKSQATAANRAFIFLSYLSTVFGALLSDLYFGKYKTILYFSIIYLLGLCILAISSLDYFIENGSSLILFLTALYLFISWATGAIKANVSAFAAEQVSDLTVEINNDPDKIYDYNLTVEKIFRYFYWAINVGGLLGKIICPIMANNVGSYPLAFSVPIIFFIIGIWIFIFGRKKYYKSAIKGNPIIKAINVIKLAFKNKEKGDNFIEKAKNNNNKSDHKFIDDLSITISSCKVFVFYIMYWALFYNMSDSFITQGMNMKKPDWLGAEQVSLVDSIVLVVGLPIFDKYVFPMLRKMGFKLNIITRITIGFSLCTLAFVYITIIQDQLYNTGPYYNLTSLPEGIKIPVNDLSIWWQIPAYALIGISEIFSSATGLEYAFKKAAPELKSIVMSLYFLTSCGGSLIGSILSIWSYDPNFVILFGSQTAVMGSMTVLFYLLFRNIDD